MSIVHSFTLRQRRKIVPTTRLAMPEKTKNMMVSDMVISFRAYSGMRGPRGRRGPRRNGRGLLRG